MVKDVEGNLKKDKIFPSVGMGVDHYICSTKGRLFTSRGKTKDTSMYTGGALFMESELQMSRECLSATPLHS